MNHSLVPLPLLNIIQQILKVSYLIIFQLLLQFALQVPSIRNSINLVQIKHIINLKLFLLQVPKDLIS